MHNYFFLALVIQCFFFLFQSLNPWLAGPYRHFRLLPPPPLPRHRPCWSDDGRARQSETTAKRKKKNKSCCQPEPTISAIYLTMATVDSKDLPHDPLPHCRQGMSSLFFSPFLLLSNRSWHCVVLLLLSLPAGNGFVMRR